SEVEPDTSPDCTEVLWGWGVRLVNARRPSPATAAPARMTRIGHQSRFPAPCLDRQSSPEEADTDSNQQKAQRMNPEPLHDHNPTRVAAGWAQGLPPGPPTDPYLPN